MSLDRMDILLQNHGSVLHSPSISQWIFPTIGFSCSGNIEGWVFGAQPGSEMSSSFVELQLWRPNNNGSYSIVGRSLIEMKSKLVQLYELPLRTPMPFQAGDVLGFYQPGETTTQLLILLEQTQNGAYKLIQPQSSNQLATNKDALTNFQPLINPKTGICYS